MRAIMVGWADARYIRVPWKYTQITRKRYSASPRSHGAICARFFLGILEPRLRPDDSLAKYWWIKKISIVHNFAIQIQ